MPSNRRSSNVNKVDTKDLANEREASRSSQIALNNLELCGIITFSRLPDDLHIERTRDLKRSSDLVRDLLQASHVALVQSERRQDEGSVTRVNTSIFDVLGNSMNKKLAFVRDGIDVNFLGIINKLGNDDGVFG